MSPSAGRAGARLVAVALGLSGAALVLWITAPWGIGVSPDSVVYLTAARSVVEGGRLEALDHTGTVRPLSIYPPLYPLLLAALDAAGVPVLVAARWLGAIALAVNAALVFALLRRHTGSTVPALLGGLILLSNRDVLYAHAMAWTEPIFVTLLLLWALALWRYLQGDRRWLVPSALAAGAAALTRYAGVSVIAAGALAVVGLAAAPAATRMRHAAVFGVVSSAPLAAWVVRNRLAAGTLADRSLSWHAMTLEDLRTGLETFASWLVPWATLPPRITLVVLFAVVGGLGILLRWRHRGPALAPGDRLPELLALFLFAYGLLLVLSISFVHPNIPLSGRILLPAFATGLVATLCLVNGALRRCRRAVAWSRAAGGVGLLLACSSAWGTWGLARLGHAEGFQYTSRQWVESGVLARVRALPPETLIYTNDHHLIYFHTGRMARRTPRKRNPWTGLSNPRYGSEIAAMLRDPRPRVLVHVRDPLRTLPAEQELLGREVYRAREGAIYELPTSKEREPRGPRARHPAPLPGPRAIRHNDGAWHASRGSPKSSRLP